MKEKKNVISVHLMRSRRVIDKMLHLDPVSCSLKIGGGQQFMSAKSLSRHLTEYLTQILVYPSS
jgi:hypothetical protein